MDFSKFIDIIATSELFFSGIKNLNDPFEGTYTKKNKNILESYLKGEISQIKELGIVTPDYKISHIRNALNFFRKTLAVNCWNINEQESAALWKIYCTGIDGIAIQSTVGRIKSALEVEEIDVYIGKVHYIDYLTDSIPFRGITTPVYYKRKSFEYENELRLVTLMPASTKRTNKNNRIISKYNEGCRIKINVDALIEQVFVSPICGSWLKKNVNLIMQKYGLNHNVCQSDLNKNPIL
jgi:hypothetical protein